MKKQPPLRIKKLAPEMRVPKPSYRLEKKPFRRFLLRMQQDGQFFRSCIQAAFVLLVVWIGIEFALFMQWGQSSGTSVYVERPPGVEGFLPISALISARYWIATGVINDIHPSGLFILVAIVALGFLLKKAFCSWLCPIGTLSESLWMLGQKIFKRNLTAPRWLDYPLRSLKYLILAFFGWSVMQMDVSMLGEFIESPYNRVADIKMYLFFAEISTFSIVTIGILIVLSIVVKNFWCRYLCPYGALLGVASWLSPLKITRTASSCIDCTLCTKACPSNINVHMATQVWSDECTGCLACVAACPVKDTLAMKLSPSSKPVRPLVFGVLVAGVFVGVTGMAMLTGHWRNAISRQEYLRRIENIESSAYQHFGARTSHE